MKKKIDITKRIYTKPILTNIGQMQKITKNNDQASTNDNPNHATHVGRV